MRSLPVGQLPGILARAVTGMLFRLMSLLPVLILGALASARDALASGDLPWWRIPFAVAIWMLCGLPFLALGLFIGHLCTSKVAVAVTQVVFFPLAFPGGMMLPPLMFPEWPNTLLLFLPSRAARDLSVFALIGEGSEPTTVVCLLVWTLVLGAVALWAARRDQGGRFR